MELPATGVPIRLTAEQVREQARRRWFNTTELCEIFAKHDNLNIHISQPQERPTNGAFFAIAMQKLREFRKDGHVWAKKKDGKTIQESHENLKVGGVVMLNCLYAYEEKENNFQRRIYRMIKKEHGDIVLFHYRKDQNQENRKIWRRGIKPIKLNPQSIQESAAGCSSGIVNHDDYQLSLALNTADTGNQNSIQANAQPSDSSNQSNIQGNAESAGDDVGWQGINGSAIKRFA
ncbi:calmodulin-binding transcription activator 2-like isoform X1 [Mangifera indica]|uniref:calmodulin-binding transcription activator 2-like isoform X1 n=1 Tax=Mangifera indica TaxID=29780 RepID=UPI001CFA422C|nr:calmodulin-binding transcription activator 2-like isoform X1 [Mangifera indica]